MDNIDFGISPQKTALLYQKMAAFGIFEKDILESFIHSGGKGGQNVNKVASCVRLKHVPSGIEVKCQDSRKQLMNRYTARCILAQKIEALVLGQESDKNQRIEKLRRQKRKRSKRAKEKLLADKRHHAKKKENRSGGGGAEGH